MSAREGGAQRLTAIDALRGVAVLAVLISHLAFSKTTADAQAGATPESVFPEWLVDALDHGRFGVHLFLVISGFCIHMAWARRNDEDAKVDFLAFWRRRLHRLYPPYVAALLLSLGGLFVLHGIFGHASGSIAAKLGYASTGQLVVDLALLLLLAQNLNGASGRVGNGPFWTLALEEQLYALYFPLLAMRKRLGWSKTIGIVLATTIVWRVIGAFFLSGSSVAQTFFFVGPARWFEWALGAIAVEVYLGRRTVPAWCRSGAVGVVLLAIAIFFVNTLRLGAPMPYVVPFTDALFGLALFVLVNFAVKVRWGDAERRNAFSRFFAWVGTFSYSLYLTHQPVIVGVKQVAMRVGIGTAGITVLRLVVPVAAAWVFFQGIERRFLNSSRKAVGSTAQREPTGGTPPVERAA
jgi:peptidoglycan/LPS O-acetylase OafA/YrhL